MTIISLIEARQTKASPSESRSRFQRPRTTNESVVSRVAATNLSDRLLLGAVGLFNAALLQWIGEIRQSLALVHVEFRRIKTETAAYLWFETPGAAVELDINLPGAGDGEGYFGGFIFVLGDAGDYVELPEGAFTHATLSDVAHVINSHFQGARETPAALGRDVR